MLIYLDLLIPAEKWLEADSSAAKNAIFTSASSVLNSLLTVQKKQGLLSALCAMENSSCQSKSRMQSKQKCPPTL